jgi:hypothetical protein
MIDDARTVYGIIEKAKQEWAALQAASRARSWGRLKSTGVPLGMMPVGLTRVIE